MTTDNGLAALLALRSPEQGRFKLREISEFLTSKLEIPISLSALSKIEHGDDYGKRCPPLIALGLIAMYNARVANSTNKLPLPAGKVHICCQRELKPTDRCRECRGRRARTIVDVKQLVKAARA